MIDCRVRETEKNVYGERACSRACRDESLQVLYSHEVYPPEYHHMMFVMFAALMHQTNSLAFCSAIFLLNFP